MDIVWNYHLWMAEGDGKTAEPRSVRLTDRISLGVLADVVPRDFIEDVLLETGRREQRSRLLPAHVMVRFCMAMCLFSDDDYEEVIRKLVGSLKDLDSWSDSWHVPSTSAITQARKRLGDEPLRGLFCRIAEPVAGRSTKGAWLRSRRLMAVDGFVLDVPDTPANDAEFGRSSAGETAGAYPQARIVGLGECGSHAIIDAAIGGYATGEQPLLQELRDSFEENMLVIADRNFYSYTLWRQAADTAADLLWRVQSTLTLPVITGLPDGSYLSAVFPRNSRPSRRASLIEAIATGRRTRPEQVLPVRVIEYQIPGPGAETIRLITTITDPHDTPATELANAYHHRWEFENLVDEVKTHQRGPGRVLRSRSPNMVKQEIWAYLLTHYCIRNLMCRAADEADIDPDELSFIRSLRIIRRQVTNQADFPPEIPQ